MLETQQPRAASPLCNKIDDEMADVMRIRNAMDQLSAQAKDNDWSYQQFMAEVIKLLSGLPDGGTGTTYESPMGTDPYSCRISTTEYGENLYKSEGEFGGVLRRVHERHEKVHHNCCEEINNLAINRGIGQGYFPYIQNATNYTAEESNTYCETLRALLTEYAKQNCGKPKMEYTCQYNDSYCNFSSPPPIKQFEPIQKSEKGFWDSLLDLL